MKLVQQLDRLHTSMATADPTQRPAEMIAAPLRRFPIGAEVQPGGGTNFRVWAPVRKRIEVVLEEPTGDRSQECLLEPGEGGYFEGLVEWAQPGFRYRFKLDDDERLYPDPASRWQPDGPHGPSEIVDPGKFQWHDQEWQGPGLKGQVLYEIHVGTFTEGGTFRSAVHELPALAELGITMLELMPVADFPGDFGWGYDGVCLYAPYHRYGSPDDLRNLIDTAHQLDMGIILDVVYNHIGPDGNYLKVYTPDYFTSRYKNE
jgi:maltooligosyltrehalose trehalohydrolase